MRATLATPALQENMRQRKGHSHAVDAKPQPVLRRELIGATLVRPEVALLDLVPDRRANFVLKGIILPRSMQSPAHVVPRARLPEWVQLNANNKHSRQHEIKKCPSAPNVAPLTNLRIPESNILYTFTSISHLFSVPYVCLCDTFSSPPPGYAPY